MSIYGSSLLFDDDEHTRGCAFYKEVEPGMFDFSGKPCDCGTPTAPLIYQGSHVLPTDDDPRGGWFGMAEIARFIYRGDPPPDIDRAEELGYGWLHPWLRIDMSGEGRSYNAIVIDIGQAKQMRDYLNGWIERVEREAT